MAWKKFPLVAILSEFVYGVRTRVYDHTNEFPEVPGEYYKLEDKFGTSYIPDTLCHVLNDHYGMFAPNEDNVNAFDIIAAEMNSL